MKKVVAVIAMLAAAAPIGFGQPQQSQSPLEKRAADVCGLFRQTSGDYTSIFAPAFLAKVPEAQLTAIFAQYFSQLGRCTATKLTARAGENAGEFDFTFEKNFSVHGNLAVNAAAPNLIEGLLLSAPTSLSATLTDIARDLKKLPGQTSLLVARLENDQVTPIAALNADGELAIGSAFKLYVLGELAREVDANERKLTDVVTLDDRWYSLPSGVLQTWPHGSPVTLHTLASFMISISDNTAADQLLNILGRERVENLVAETKHAQSNLNQPFLSTLEMFKLKGEPTHKAAEQYLALDVNGRRRFLAEQIAAIKREDTKPFADGKPAYIDRIEWFASATDLCRIMNWLRRNTEPNTRASSLRDVLSINTGSGLNVSRERWSFIGFKGGSEPGVLNMTYLLQSKSGQWYAMAITWNDPTAPLDNSKVFGLVQRALQII